MGALCVLIFLLLFCFSIDFEILFILFLFGFFFLYKKGGNPPPCYPFVACCFGSISAPLWMECILRNGRRREDRHCDGIVHAGPAQSVSFVGF